MAYNPETGGHVHKPEVMVHDDTRFAQRASEVDTQFPHTPETEVLFADLYKQYQNKIYNHVYGMMGNPNDGEELSQDTFLKAYRKLPEAVTRGKFQAQGWLYEIATNVCLDELRHRQRVKWTPWESFMSTFHPSQVAKNNTEEDVLERERQTQVQEVLDKLPPNYRTALVLREYHGLDYEGIAKYMGITKDAIKSMIPRARQVFRINCQKMHPYLPDGLMDSFDLPKVPRRKWKGRKSMATKT